MLIEVMLIKKTCNVFTLRLLLKILADALMSDSMSLTVLVTSFSASSGVLHSDISLVADFCLLLLLIYQRG